jgi:hypothetical protein
MQSHVRDVRPFFFISDLFMEQFECVLTLKLSTSGSKILKNTLGPDS